MKNRIFYLLIVLLTFSCESDFLERPPLDAIGEDSYWRTATDLENYVLQYYPFFPTHGIWGSGMPREERNSDNLIIATPNVIINGERGGSSGRWTNDWSFVRSVNIFFDNYEKCEDDFELYKHYLGEAHFFRAWVYFELVKKYGDVPIYTTQLLPNMEDELIKPRDPRTEVVDFILSDLDKASEYLDFRSRVGNNRVNKESALVFKSRVALFEGTWQKYHAGTVYGTNGSDPNKYFMASVDAVEELVNGNYRVGLHKDYYELFGLDDMSGSDEVMLFRAYDIADGLSNDLQYNTSFATSEMGITWSLVKSYLDKNGEIYDYLGVAINNKGNDFLTKISNEVDSRLGYSVWAPGDLEVLESGQTFEKPGIDKVEVQLNPTGFEVKKFSNPSSSGAGKGGGGNSETGYILFRFGEALLNYAEALYELNSEVAYTELNLLRQRVGMPNFKVHSQSSDPNLLDYGYPISDELYEIRRERRVELALENHREDDYRRWAAHALFKGKRPKGYPFNQAEFPEYHPPLDENGLIDYFQNRLPNGYQFRESQDYLNSIPIEELTLNPNLVQNPGW